MLLGGPRAACRRTTCFTRIYLILYAPAMTAPALRAEQADEKTKKQRKDLDVEVRMTGCKGFHPCMGRSGSYWRMHGSEG